MLGRAKFRGLILHKPFIFPSRSSEKNQQCFRIGKKLYVKKRVITLRK